MQNDDVIKRAIMDAAHQLSGGYAEIGRQCGQSKGNISRIATSRTDSILEGNWLSLWQVLVRYSPDLRAPKYLPREELEKFQSFPAVVSPSRHSSSSCPVYSMAQMVVAGLAFSKLGLTVPDGATMEVQVPAGLDHCKTLAAFRIIDNSMAPTVGVDDIVYISPNLTVSNGNIVLALQDGELLFGRWNRVGSAEILSFDNPSFAPRLIATGEAVSVVRVVGVTSIKLFV